MIPISEEFDRRRSPKDITREIKEFNAWLKEYASRHNYPYVDYFAALSDDRGYLRKEFAKDGIHPNARGYQVLSTILQRTLDDLYEPEDTTT